MYQGRCSLLSCLLLLLTMHGAESSLDLGLTGYQHAFMRDELGHVMLRAAGPINDLTKDRYMTGNELKNNLEKTLDENKDGSKVNPLNSASPKDGSKVNPLNSTSENSEKVTETESKVKPQKVRPSYCHPHNPCPKGYKGKDGCLEVFENTAEFNRKWNKDQQDQGLCECDRQHMDHCLVKSYQTSSSSSSSEHASQQMISGNK
jgi:hypothetical protein